MGFLYIRIALWSEQSQDLFRAQRVTIAVAVSHSREVWLCALVFFPSGRAFPFLVPDGSGSHRHP